MNLAPRTELFNVCSKYFGLVTAAFAVVFVLTFTTEASANTPTPGETQTMKINRISLALNDNAALLKGLTLELRIDDTHTVQLDEDYSYNSAVEIQRHQPNDALPELVRFHLKRVGPTGTNPWINTKFTQAFVEGDITDLTVEVNIEIITDLLADEPESESAVIIEAKDTEISLLESDVEQLSSEVSTLKVNIDNLNGEIVTQNETIRTLDTTINGSSSEYSNLNSEITKFKSDLTTLEIKLNQGSPNVNSNRDNNNKSPVPPWVIWGLAGLIVIGLITLGFWRYRKVNPKTAREFEQTRDAESSHTPSQIFNMSEEELRLTVLSLNADIEQKDHDFSELVVLTKKRIQNDQEKFEKILSESHTSINELAGQKTELEEITRTLSEINDNLQETVNRAQPYLDRQEKVSDIKSNYEIKRSEVQRLVVDSDPARALLSRVVDRSIDTQTEYDYINGQLEILQVLETALTDYRHAVNATMVHSSNLIGEIESANAGKRVEIAKQLINDQLVDSLTTIPKILEDIRAKIERPHVDQSVFANIAAYKRFLEAEHTPMVRAVPLSVTDILQRLCEEAEAGEVEAIEALAGETIEALKTTYGSRD